jgi:hypothetical protein
MLQSEFSSQSKARASHAYFPHPFHWNHHHLTDLPFLEDFPALLNLPSRRTELSTFPQVLMLKKANFFQRSQKFSVSL